MLEVDIDVKFEREVSRTMRTAFLFPGQGSFRPGCLAAWTGHPEEHVIRRVAAISGLDLWSADGDDQTGRRTVVAQPTILAASLAAVEALRTAGVTPDVVAGHSLGELTAAGVARVFHLGATMRLVAERGRAMADACAGSPGGLSAVVRLDVETVRSILADIPDATIANENGAGQTVVGGTTAALEAVAVAVRDTGGRALPLDVEGAFHTPAMAPAMVRVDRCARTLEIRDPVVPLVTGTSGAVLRRGEDVRRAVVEGVLAPVRWTAVMDRLIGLGVTTVIEVGPGGALAGMAKRALPDVELLTVTGPDDVAEVAGRLAEPRVHLPV